MTLSTLFTIFSAFEGFAEDFTASYFEFWGACMEALTNADLRDL
jgi:hypothetical protein